MRVRDESVLAFAAALAIATSARAAVDTLSTVLTSTQTVGGVTTPSAFGAYGYNASSGSFYAIGFYGTGQDARQIATDGTITRLLTQTPYALFTKTDPNNGGGSATPGSLLLNPKAILNPDGSVAIPAYGTAIIDDGAALVTTGVSPNQVKHPELSQRVYRLDLYKFANGTATAPVANGATVLTSLVTTTQLGVAAGVADNTVSTNDSRQGAYSGDGQSYYFVDTSTAFGGIYKTSVLTGAVTRISTANENTEPGVVTVNGVDHIYIKGGGSTGNTNGIDYVDANTGTRSIAVSAATLQSFFGSTAAVSTASITTDAAGNVYFNDAVSSVNGGIYELDTQGRIIKLVSYAERKAFAGVTVNANTLRMQTRAATYTGTGGTFGITQVLFDDSSPVNGVTAVNVFKPGDFNRDNSVTTADLSLFGGSLTVRNVAQTDATVLKYDLNGDNVVDFHDVKILQQFVGFSNGDANLDLKTDYADLGILAANYNGTLKTFIQGDLTGDDAVTYADLVVEAGAFATAGITPTLTDLTSRYTGQFLTDAEAAFGLTPVPEPTALAGLLIAGGGLLRRRRKE